MQAISTVCRFLRADGWCVHCGGALCPELWVYRRGSRHGGYNKNVKQEGPGSRCSFAGSLRELLRHWAEIHHPKVLLWMCPIDTCQYWSRKHITTSMHRHKKHKLATSKIWALQDLPLLLQVVDSKRCCNPRSDVAPLTASQVSGGR